MKLGRLHRFMMLALFAAVHAACGTGTGGHGGALHTGGSGGATGGTGCLDPTTDCPAPATACQTPACDAGACVTGPSPAGTACSDGGGKVCDGVGACVACNDDADCAGDPTKPVCASHLCVAGTCTDATKNGDETDEDCGGSCPPCANGLRCAVNADCQSLSCDVATCAACGLDADCDAGHFCDVQAGQCKPVQAGASACDGDGQCQSGHCVDGVCCDTACAGTCRACDVVGSEGTCSNAPAGQPDQDNCPGAQLCDGAGACAAPNGAPCAGAAACASGLCADGVCCDTACAGACEACDVVGSVGTCSNVPAGQSDPGTCAVPKVCSGLGLCIAPNGSPCAGAAECLAGLCVDGVCCSTGCTLPCMACDVAGSVGACSPVPSGQQDPVTCTGAAVCNGSGACLGQNGQPCSSPNLCMSNLCVDGYCCGVSCAGTCRACNVQGSTGTCSLVPWGQKDAVTCAGTGVACDGAGACLLEDGFACTAGNKCLSGICADATCCDAACTGTCMACNLPGKTGTCVAVPAGVQDPGSCTGNKACNGAGACLSINGAACTQNGDCASGFCADGHCCNQACDAPCLQCNGSGSLGSCVYVDSGQQDLPSCSGTSACDGAGKCLLASGQPCTQSSECAGGVCKATTHLCM